MTHPNGRHHRECQKTSLLSNLYFDFLNRMDEVNNMFEGKVFATKKSVQITNDLPNSLWFDCNGYGWSDHIGVYGMTYINEPFTLFQKNIVRYYAMNLTFEGRKFFEDENCVPRKKREDFESRMAKCGSQWYPNATIPCQNDPTRCVLPSEMCDGFPQCPNATDESLHNCSHKYSSATFECTKYVGNGFSIPILAFRCNGIKECSNGADEEGCFLLGIITYSVLLPGFVICLTAAIVVVYKTKSHLIDANVELDALYGISCPKEKSRKLIEVQNVRSRKVHNRKYYNDILESSNGDQAETLNEIKKNVGPSVTKTLLEDIDRSKSFFKTLKVFIFSWIEKIPWKIRIVLSITKSLFTHFGDIIKDVLLLITIGRLTQGADFFLAWVSILVIIHFLLMLMK